jgi:integrase/recombinase XerD
MPNPQTSPSPTLYPITLGFQIEKSRSWAITGKSADYFPLEINVMIATMHFAFAPPLIDLPDRALIDAMVYSFARVSATLGMRVEDYYIEGRRAWFRLHEKGGKRNEVPAHHNAENYLDAYLEAAGIADDRKGWLFRSIDRERVMTIRPMHRSDALRMIKKRAKAVGLSEAICCHTFRATGITAYLENGGTIEHAQQIACHESPKTTKLYDRTSDHITLSDVEKIVI